MHSIPTEKTRALVPQAEQQLLTHWHALLPDEQALVAAYIENSYSATHAAAALGKKTEECKRLLARPGVRRAITEVQATLDDIDFLNEKWVKTQLLRLFPMAMGDEPVKMVTQTGEELEVRKFHGDIAMKIVEYVAPKAQKTPAVNISINNISKLSDADLERIAASAGGRVVSEQ